jgi:hypothetical protein
MATSRILGSLAVAMLIGVVPVGGQQVSTPAKRDRRVITAEEIEQAQEMNAFDVVQKLRPEFLRRMSQVSTLGAGGRAIGAGGAATGVGGTATGGGGTATGGGGQTYGGAGGSGAMGQPYPGSHEPDPRPTGGVFVDGTEMGGGIDELRQIPASTVEEIRYISASDVDMRYGPRFPNGVIEVTLRKH